MKRIHFTEEHFKRLYNLAADALFNGTTFVTKLGQQLNVYELLHTTSINQLTEIMNSLSKKIEKMKAGDEWLDPDNEKIYEFETQKELVNLTIGLKRFHLEKELNRKEREKLEAQLAELKESQKTPEDRIRELEEKLKEYDSVEF